MAAEAHGGELYSWVFKKKQQKKHLPSSWQITFISAF